MHGYDRSLSMDWLTFYELAELAQLTQEPSPIPFVDSSIFNQQRSLKFFDDELQTLLKCTQSSNILPTETFLKNLRLELASNKREKEKSLKRADDLSKLVFSYSSYSSSPLSSEPAKPIGSDLKNLFPSLFPFSASSQENNLKNNKKPPSPSKVPLDPLDKDNISEIPFLFENALFRNYVQSSLLQFHPPNLSSEDLEAFSSLSDVCSEIWGSSLLNVCQGNVHRWNSRWNTDSEALILKKKNFLDLKGALSEFSKRPSFGGDDVGSYLNFVRFVLRLDGLKTPSLEEGSNLYFLRFPCNKEKLYRGLTSGKHSLLPLVNGVRFAKELNSDFAKACKRGENFSSSRLWELASESFSSSSQKSSSNEPLQTVFLRACWYALSLAEPMLGVSQSSLDSSRWTDVGDATTCWNALESKVSLRCLTFVSNDGKVPNGPIRSIFSDWFEILEISTSECMLAIRKDLWLIWACGSFTHRLSRIPTAQILVKHWELLTANFPLLDNVRKFFCLRKILSWLTKMDENRTLQFLLTPDHPDFSAVYGNIFSEVDMWNKSAFSLNEALTQAFVHPGKPNVLSSLLSKILVKKRHAVDRSVIGEIRKDLSQPRERDDEQALRPLFTSAPRLLHVLDKLAQEPSSIELALSIDRAAKSASYRLLKTSSEDVLSTNRRGRKLKRRLSQVDPDGSSQREIFPQAVNFSDATRVGADPKLVEALARRFVCTGTYGTGELVRSSQAKKRRKKADPELLEHCKESFRSVRREYSHVLEDAGCLAEILMERERVFWNNALADLHASNWGAERKFGKNSIPRVDFMDVSKSLIWDCYDLRCKRRRSLAQTARKKDKRGPFSSKDSWLLLAELVASKSLYQATSRPGISEDLRKKLFLSMALVDETAFEASVAASMAARYVVVDPRDADLVLSRGFAGGEVPPSSVTQLGSLQDFHHPFNVDRQFRSSGLVLEHFCPAHFDPPHVHRRTGKSFLKYVDSKWEEKKSQIDELIFLTSSKSCKKSPSPRLEREEKNPSSQKPAGTEVPSFFSLIF